MEDTKIPYKPKVGHVVTHELTKEKHLVVSEATPESCRLLSSDGDIAWFAENRFLTFIEDKSKELRALIN